MHSYNAKQLQKAGRNIKLPLCLSLEGSNNDVICNKLLRIVPKRRAVLSGQWGKEHVVAKLYYQPHHIKRHIQREISGAKALKNAGIQTASLLFSGNDKGLCIGVLLFEYIDSPVQFEHVWKQSASIKDKQVLLTNLIQIIAAMHNNGLIQNDLHFNNFIVKHKTVYAIDAASIKIYRHRRLLSIQKRLNNLAVLFSQLSLTDMHFVPTAYKDYLNATGLTMSDYVFKTFANKISHARKQKIRRYVKKIFRESTRHIHQKSFTRLMVCNRSFYSASMAALLKHPDQTLQNSEHIRLKTGNSSTVTRININGTDFVVKRYNIKNFRHQLKRLFMTTRAAGSWKNAHRLTALGIKTPTPVALLEKRIGPFRSTAYYISKYIKGPDAACFFKTDNRALQKNITHKIVQLFEALKSAGISHGDMKATNIIISDEKPFLIDLDAMQTHISRKRFNKAHQKDLIRFNKNWNQLPNVGKMFNELLDKPLVFIKSYPPIEHKQNKKSCCPICSSAGSYIYTGKDRLLNRSAELYDYHQCDDCSAVFQYPMPDTETISSFYPDDYSVYEIAKPKATGNMEKGVLRFRYGYKHLKISYPYKLLAPISGLMFYKNSIYYKKNGKALDVGCGNGSFLYKLKKLGWKCTGVDFSSSAVKACRANGLDVYAGELKDIEFSNNTFDFVSARHVIEHISDPDEFIREIVRVLKPGGKLLIQTPNSEALARNWFKTFWFANDIPRHLILFSKNNLDMLLKRHGMQKIKLNTSTTAKIILNSIDYRFGNRTKPSKKNKWLRMLAKIYVMMASISGRGDELYLMYKKL